MKMKGKSVVPGNGLSALADRHKAAARTRVQTHRMSRPSRPGAGRNVGKKG